MKLLREPLLHFVLLGAALFLVYTWHRDRADARQAQSIEIDAVQIELLVQGWSARWNRPPTAAELQGLIDARIREEVLYREALKVGFDRDDTVVRRRMVQKMEMLTQDLAGMIEPTDDELRAFLEEYAEDYRVPPRVSFSHVYFNTDNRGAAVKDDALQVLTEIRALRAVPENAADRGDRFMLGFDYRMQSPADVDREFGRDFSAQLFELSPGWHGPLTSGYGQHLVHVIERVEGRMSTLDEVRQRLATDLTRTRRDQAAAALYDGLLNEYQVDVDRSAIETLTLDARE